MPYAVLIWRRIAQNHPFNDANKRTALIAIRLFLELNGYELTASPEEKYKTIICVAANDISQIEVVQWIRKKIRKDNKLNALSSVYCRSLGRSMLTLGVVILCMLMSVTMRDLPLNF